MSKKPTVKFALKAYPWPLHIFETYAKVYGYSPRATFEIAMLQLFATVPKEAQARWLKEYKELVRIKEEAKN